VQPGFGVLARTQSFFSSYHLGTMRPARLDFGFFPSQQTKAAFSTMLAAICWAEMPGKHPDVEGYLAIWHHWCTK